MNIMAKERECRHIAEQMAPCSEGICQAEWDKRRWRHSHMVHGKSSSTETLKKRKLVKGRKDLKKGK
jgi:hypothetical protein